MRQACEGLRASTIAAPVILPTAARDIGSVEIGKEAVDKGLIDEVGGVGDAVAKLKSMIDEQKKNKGDALH